MAHESEKKSATRQAGEIQCSLGALPEERVGDFASMSDLHERLSEVWAIVREAWPTITTPTEVFFPYLAQRISDEQISLDGMDVAGLYLACACVAQEAIALESFQRILTPYARGLVLRMGLTPSDADDLVGTLNEQLLVGGGTPRILQFEGRGGLHAWLKVSVTRMGLRQRKTRDRQVPQSIDAQLLPEGSGDDVVLAYLRKQYRQPFLEAFREAFQTLSSEDRLLMRQKFMDGLTGDELASLHQLHRATVVRKLARARQTLVGEIRNRLIEKLQVSDNEVDSIIRVLRSQLDASFHSLLGIHRGDS
ncbi:MAG: hypothetical protein JKY56_19480 [Kofleriaceae bacterium]|nr:hypothetical protein [Kofleriaceae bacterium]